MGTILQDLTTDALISYANANGTYTFSPAANLLRVTHRFILDQAKRTVTHTLHTFVIEDILQASDQLDGTKVDTAAIRRILGYPGGQLIVTGVGVGAFSANLNQGVGGPNPRDCLWGPIPAELAWENYGNGKAGKMVWQFTCATPEQCADAASQGSVMAYNYDAVFTKDKSGMQKRIITGYVEIPMTQATPGDRVPPDNVDRLRESCYPSIQLGWMRTGDTWKVSMDRRRADFVYTDEEQPYNAPAPGVVTCEETETVESDNYILGLQTVTLSGSYEMSMRRQRSESWVHFRNFCQSRINAISNVFGPNNAALFTPIPIKLRMEEPCHSRTSGRFSLTLQYTLDATNVGIALANAVLASGLWTPLPESSYAPWQESMTDDGVFTARGRANTSFPKGGNSDTIIDLCLGAASVPTLSSSGVKPPGGLAKLLAINFPLPKPASSYLAYLVGMRVDDFDSVVELKPLPTAPILYAESSNGAANVAGFMPAYPNTPTSVLQDRCGSLTAVTIYGAALRAGYLIAPPVPKLIGGVVPRRQNREGNFFDQWVWGNYGIPIMASAWSQRYILPSQPTGYGAVPNPLSFPGSSGGKNLISVFPTQPTLTAG